MRTLLPRRLVALVTACAMLASVFALIGAPSAQAAPVVIASDLTSGPSVGLISFTDDPLIPFSNPGDGFQVYQRGVSASIPFSIADDSLLGFPADNLGIVDENNLDPFFGATDTVNDDTTGPVSAAWVFDITGATNLSLSIDMGAMGDFEGSDSFEWTYSIDAGPPATAFSLVADEDDSRNYTLAGGAIFTLEDPLNVGAIALDNVLQPVSTPIVGTGSQLALTLTVNTDGGSESVAFQNILVTQDDGGPVEPVPGDLVITEIIQNPAAVADGSGEWFEIQNVSGNDIDLDGWTIADLGSDSHVIAGPLVVAAGDYVVLGNNTDPLTNGGATVDYSYGGSWFLSNSADEVLLLDDTLAEFDRVVYDGGPSFPDPTGASMNLDPTLTDTVSNDDGANWCTATSTYGDGDLGTPGAANSSCDAPPAMVLIHEIQGSGPAVVINTPVEVQAIVTSLFERDDALDGFFIQEEDADADADPATSEGIFVFCRGNCPASLSTGDLVTVNGTPTDFAGMSQIDAAAGTVVVDAVGQPLPAAIPTALPAAGSTSDEATFEATEGMIVTFPDTLVVSEYFQLARFGQLVLTETSRPAQYTHSNVPDPAGYAAFLADLATRRIILDDDNNDNNDNISDGPDEQYAYPDGGLALTNRFRGGDTISGLSGVMHWSWAGSSGTDAWRIRPIPDAVDYTFTVANPAPATPDDVGGTIQAASFNVLNFFTTVDVTSSNSSGDCGPGGTLDCRGADSIAELARQQDKIVAAMAQMDADVLGLIELENDGDDSSIAALVAGLNAAVGGGTYHYIATGFIGDDAIKVGLIYDTATVAPAGAFAILDSSVDPTFLDSKNRPVLVQTFDEIASGERFTMAVNHLKSKGSPCDDVGDPGLDDGQANCPGTRTAAATALANYLATDPTGSGDPDFLILGDLNAYAKEDPITALQGAGYTDLVEAFGGPTAYSYVFDGQLGYLDHALANASLLGQVTGTSAWHINADEVPIFDYNDDIQDVGEASFERESSVANVYAPDALRSSDHDPVLIGLNLSSIPANPTCHGLAATIVGTAGPDSIVGTNGNDVIVTFGGDDIIDAGNGKDTICSGAGDDTVDGGNGNDLIDGGDGDDTLNGGDGKDLVIGGDGNDTINGSDGKDRLKGGEGDDTINGDDGKDLIIGGSGNDVISGGNGTDVIDGGAGDDTIAGDDGHDLIGGGSGNDVIRGGNGKDWILGGAGDDQLFGDDGKDLIIGGPGTDFGDGGDGKDRCRQLDTAINCES